MMKKRIRRSFCVILAAAMLLEGNLSTTLAATVSEGAMEETTDTFSQQEEEKYADYNVNYSEILEEDRVVENLNISASLNLNGHQLIVKGNVTQTSGTISFNQGSLICEGNYTMKGNSSLSMKAQEDSLLIEGTFTSNLSNDLSQVVAGVIQFDGDFIQNGNGKNGNFITKGTSEVIFGGNSKQKIDFESPYSYFSKVTLKNTNADGVTAKRMLNSVQLNRNGVKIQSEMHGRYGWTLTKDEEIDSDLVLIGDMLNLNGYTLTVKGDLIQENGVVDINGGTLKVEGDYRVETEEKEPVSAQLQSTKQSGSLEVDGDFVMRSILRQEKFTDGVLKLKGNLLQYETKVKDNFVMSGNSTLIMSGNEKQQIMLNTSDENQCILQNWEIENKAGVELLDEIAVKGKITDHDNLIEGKAIILQNNTTFTDEKYNGNVIICAYNRLKQLKKIGGSLTVNRNSELKGDLIVEGDVYVNYNVDIKNYTFEVGGNLYVRENLNVNTGKIICRNDLIMEKDKNGRLSMTNDNAYLLVEGDFYAKNQNEVYENWMSAGTLEIKGDFTQETTKNVGNFRTTGTHKTIFSGEKEQKIFFSDSKSYFNIVEINNQGGVYAPQGIYAAKLLLNGNKVRTDVAGQFGWIMDKDETIEGDFELASGEMDLNGHTLRVKGDIIQSGGSMNINGGKLIVEKDYRIQSRGEEGCGESNGYLIMTNAEDEVEVCGEFVMGSIYSHKNKLTKGTFNVKGDVQGISYSSKENFVFSQECKFVLNGDTKQTVNLEEPGFSKMYVSNLEIQNSSEEGVLFENEFPVLKTVNDYDNKSMGEILVHGDTLFANKRFKGNVRIHDYGYITGLQKVEGNLTISYISYLTQDMQVGGDLIIDNAALRLMGKCLETAGKVKINAGNIDIVGGSLICNQDLELAYSSKNASFLNMTNSKDYVLVKGNMSIDSQRTPTNIMTKGVLELKGDFTQTVQSHTDNFKTEKECKVIFSGTDLQTVSFESEDSYFSYVELKNTSPQGVYAKNGIYCKELNVGECNYQTELDGKSGWKLSEDEVIEGDLKFVQGTLDLNGKKLTIRGNLLQSGGCVDIHGGELIVEGNYAIQNENNGGCWASLKMNQQTDYVEVQKDFIMASYADHKDYLTAGQLFVEGNFIQRKTKHETNFYTEKEFRLILCGNKAQSIEMQNSTQSTSCIANMEINNTGDEAVELNDVLVTGEVEVKQGKLNGYLSIVNTTKFLNERFPGNVLVKEETRYKYRLSVDGDFRVSKDFYANEDVWVGGKFNSTAFVNLQGHNLEIEGNMNVQSNIILLNGGSMLCHGDLSLKYAERSESGFRMLSEDEYVCVEGNLYIDSARALTLTAGTLELKGDLIQGQYGVKNTFVQKAEAKTILSGIKKQTIHFSDSGSQLGTLIIKNESDEGVYFEDDLVRAIDVIRNDCRVTCKGNGTYGWTLHEDTVLEEDLNIITDTLDLNGHKLTINGNLCLSSGKIDINGGELEVTNDFRIQGFNKSRGYYSSTGALVMNNKADIVRVGRDFIVQTEVGKENLLTEGKIYINGDFWQKESDGGCRNNFIPVENHTVIFEGDSEQKIYFANPQYSWFQNVKIASKERMVKLLSTVFCKGEVEDEKQKVSTEHNGFKGRLQIEHLSQLKKGKFGGNILLIQDDEMTNNVNIRGQLYTNNNLKLGTYTLSVGELEKEKGELDIAQGRLYVENNMKLVSNASLTMNQTSAYVQVKGDAILELGKATLTDGISEFCGSVNASRNLIAMGEHKTILSGKKIGTGRDYIQNITFQGLDNKWNILVIKKNLENCYTFSREVDKMCNELRVEIEDEEAPTKVQNLICKKNTTTTAELSWDAAMDNEKVAGYWVYRNSKQIGMTTNTTYTDVELTPETSYQYQVVAFDEAENASESSESIEIVTKEDVEAPSIPKGVNIYSQTGTAITITWNYSSDNVGTVGYEVYRDGEFMGNIEGSRKTMYRDISCAEGKKYEYQILAYDKAGNKSEMSEKIKGELLAPKIHSFNLEDGEVLGGENVTLTVSYDNHGNVQSDKVKFEYSKDDGQTWIAINPSLLGQNDFNAKLLYSGYTWDIRRVTSGTYKLRATLFDMDGNQDVKEISCIIDKDGAKPPEYVYAEPESGTIELEWSQSASASCIEYIICRENGDEIKTLATISDRKNTSYVDRDVKEGERYQYQIITVDKFGQKGIPSEKVSAVAGKDVIPPVVKNLYAQTEHINEKTRLQVKAEDNVSVEKVRIEYKNGDTWIKVAEIQEDKEESAQLTELPEDGTFEFRAIAVDAAGNESTPFLTKFNIDKKGVAAPENLKASVQKNNVRFTWEAPKEKDFAYYAVEQKIDQEYTQVAMEGQKAGVYVKNLEYNTVYQFRVVGYDTTGNRGEVSEEIKVKIEPDIEGPSLLSFKPDMPYYQKSIPLEVACKDEGGLLDVRIMCSDNHEKWTEVGRIDIPEGEKQYKGKYDIDISDFPEGKVYVRLFVTDVNGNVSGNAESVMERTFYHDLTPPEPVEVKAVQDENYMHVMWNAPKEEDYNCFDVYRLNLDTREYECVKKDTYALDYYDEDCEIGSTYFYKVIVKDLAGNCSDYSKIAQGRLELSGLNLNDKPMVEVAGLVAGKKDKNGDIIVGENATFHSLVYGYNKLSKITISYREKGSDTKWIKVYEGKLQNKEDEIYFEWTNSHLEDGKYEFLVSATDEKGNCAQPYTKTFVLKKAKSESGQEIEPEIETNSTETEKTVNIKTTIDTDTMQRIGLEYSFDASESSSSAAAICDYHWDFGDGTTGKGVAPVHSYEKTGEYTVTLTVTDIKGNQDSFMQRIEAVAKKSGGVRVNVTAENGIALTDAFVQIEKSPEGKPQEGSTDFKGTYESTLKKGTYKISVYKPGYLPKQEIVKVNDGVVKNVKFVLPKQEVVTGQLSHRKLDMREIIALGVDLENMDNWHIIEYETIRWIDGRPQRERIKLRDGEFVKDGNGYSGFLVGGHGSSLGSSGGVYVHYEKKRIAFLKQMFEVELELTNHASKEFSVTKNIAKLNLPEEGLSFIDFEDKRVQDTQIDFDSFEGETTKKLNWYIRGDKPGDYNLSVDYSGRLQPFDQEITAHIVDPEPVNVTLENENTDTDPEFLEGETNPQTYLLSVYNLIGEKISGAYVELDYNGASTRAITNSEGDAYLQVKQKDCRVFKLTVTKKGYPDYVNDYYTLCTEGSDYVHIGGKNNEGVSYPDENTSYEGDFALLNVLVDNHNLMDSEKKIERRGDKDVSFVLQFSDKIKSAKIMMEKDGECDELDYESSTISQNKKEFQAKVAPKKLKEGCLFRVEAVDEEEGVRHKYTLRNVQVVDKYSSLQEAKPKTIDISLNKTDKKGSVTTTFDPNWLTKPSNQYNHELARFNMALASVAYCEDEGDEYSSLRNKNYYDALTSLGFKVDGGEYCLKLATDDKGGPTKKEARQTIHYYLASNKYKMKDEIVDVVILTLRGTKGNEWYDNFDIDLHNTGKDQGKNCQIHDGFNNGASAVKKALKEYIRVNNLTSNTKIIITGHSRGAAVTNLLAAQLGAEGNVFENIKGEKHKADVYAYAYACPNTVSRTVTQKKNYDNIYNFVNPQDFVTKVVPSAWGFGRYGTTYVFPDKIASNKLLHISADVYNVFKKKMLENLSQYWNQSEYEEYPDGMQTVSNLINTITERVSNIEEYYKKDIKGKYGARTIVTLHDMFYDTLAKYMVKGSAEYFVLGSLHQYAGKIGYELAKFFIGYNAMGNHIFEYSHTYETYLAMINAISEFDLLQPKMMVNGIINCPVDIEIYDSDDKMIGRIKDNVVDTSIDPAGKVALEVIGDSKRFTIDAALNYRIKLIGNDDGKMDYILSTEDVDAGEEQRILFKNIPIANKKTMEMNITPDTDLKEQILKNENGVEIQYNQLLDREELNTLSIKAEVDGIGTASSFANLTYGDAVVLKAETDENNEFKGWYDNDGKFLSKETEYPVIVKENKIYYARFTNNFVPLQNFILPDLVQMDIGDIATFSVETSPKNATVKSCVFESTNEEIVQVDDFGILQAKKAGTAKIKVSSDDGKVVQYITVVVGKDTPLPSPKASEEPILSTPYVTSSPSITEKPSSDPTTSLEPAFSLPNETSTPMSTNKPMMTQTPTEKDNVKAKLPNFDEKDSVANSTGIKQEQNRKQPKKYNRNCTLPSVRIKRITRRKKGVFIKFAKVKRAKKYQIQWSTKKTFRKTKTITLKKSMYMIKCKKRKLYLRIRAINKNCVGNWSKPKKIGEKK